MATLIPSFRSCSMRMTPGERRLAQRLKSKLGDDYLIWYDVPIGKQRKYPDFIILHPVRGLFVLEVKDWKIDTIISFDRKTAKILANGKEKEVKNPLEQARDYALTACELLEKDKLLVQSQGRYKGKLVFPYSYGVVFANIARQVLETEEGFREVFEPNFVICKDEINVDSFEFEQRLWNICSYEFGQELTSPQIERVRWLLFPDARISYKQLSLFEDKSQKDTKEELVPDIMKVMDLQQEQLARSLGEGHRVIHGVAGSGKTLILACRCQYLAEQITAPILVLCFNVSLATKLRHILREKGIGTHVEVKHFHGWCSDLLKEHDIDKPNWNKFPGNAYCLELVWRVISGVDKGIIPAGSYGAVILDEGHDFQPEWLKLIAQMVDPKTNFLLLMYDDAQDLYRRRNKKKFNFKSLGIKAQGRTTILKINYRNTTEVLTLAYEFAKEFMNSNQEQDEDAPVLISPKSAGRHGELPELIQLPKFSDEIDYIAKQAQKFNDQGILWNEIAIIYRSKFMGERIYKSFKQAEIPIEWVNKDSLSRNYNPGEESVKLITMHSSKGLEFHSVFIPGVGYMPNEQNNLEEEVRLLYVAMTRAIESLVITYDRISEFSNRLKIALEKVA